MLTDDFRTGEGAARSRRASPRPALGKAARWGRAPGQVHARDDPRSDRRRPHRLCSSIVLEGAIRRVRLGPAPRPRGRVGCPRRPAPIVDEEVMVCDLGPHERSAAGHPPARRHRDHLRSCPHPSRVVLPAAGPRSGGASVAQPRRHCGLPGQGRRRPLHLARQRQIHGPAATRRADRFQAQIVGPGLRHSIVSDMDRPSLQRPRLRCAHGLTGRTGTPGPVLSRPSPASRHDVGSLARRGAAGRVYVIRDERPIPGES